MSVQIPQDVEEDEEDYDEENEDAASEDLDEEDDEDETVAGSVGAGKLRGKVVDSAADIVVQLVYMLRGYSANGYLLKSQAVNNAWMHVKLTWPGLVAATYYAIAALCSRATARA